MKHFLLLICFTSLVAAYCDVGSTEFHIDPSAASSSPDGSELSPYTSIMEAFDAQIALTIGASNDSSFCFKLW